MKQPVRRLPVQMNENTFERLMETVLSGLNWQICLIYLDDIIVYGKPYQDIENRRLTTWPRPENVHQVRAFIGFCSYYRRFIENFAEIAKPLRKLT